MWVGIQLEMNIGKKYSIIGALNRGKYNYFDGH